MVQERNMFPSIADASHVLDQRGKVLDIFCPSGIRGWVVLNKYLLTNDQNVHQTAVLPLRDRCSMFHRPNAVQQLYLAENAQFAIDD